MRKVSCSSAIKAATTNLEEHGNEQVPLVNRHFLGLVPSRRQSVSALEHLWTSASAKASVEVDFSATTSEVLELGLVNLTDGKDMTVNMIDQR